MLQQVFHVEEKLHIAQPSQHSLVELAIKSELRALEEILLKWLDLTQAAVSVRMDQVKWLFKI